MTRRSRWRRGIDLDSVDVERESATRWLEALGLRAALSIARQAPPLVVRRDLRESLQPIVAGVPAGATLVVFHSAVLAYVPADDRAAFAAQVGRMDCVWIANEGAGVLKDLQQHIDDDELAAHRGHFLLSRDGVPVAWTDPHGAWLAWR